MPRRPATGPPRGSSYGMFAGNPPDPQVPEIGIARELLDSLTDDPGLRLAPGMGRRLYTGGALTLHRTTMADSGPNSEAVVEVAGVVTGNSRRALGRFRGFPPGTGPARG